MSYRKRRVGRRRKSRVAGSFLTISVLVCGVLIYALYTSSAGKWIKSNYIDPVFFEQKQNNDTTPTTAPTPTTQLGAGKEHTLSLDGFTVYAMQTGAFSGQENATKKAEEIRKQGGAGYVYKDDVYRVFAFGYKSESEANVVRDQLKSVGNLDSSVYTLSVPKIDFRVTGEQNNYEKVNESFKVYLDVKDKVNELAVKFDKKEIDKATAKNELDALSKRLKDSLSNIEKMSKSDEKLGRFAQLYKDTIALFDGVSDSDDVIFSGSMKNIYIEMICGYSNYVTSLTS